MTQGDRAFHATSDKNSSHVDAILSTSVDSSKSPELSSGIGSQLALSLGGSGRLLIQSDHG